jgi:hypothetical protein
MIQELPDDLLIFIHPTLQLKFCPHYKPYKFPSEVFGGMFLWFKFLGFLVHVRLLHLHVDAVFGELLNQLFIEISRRLALDLNVYKEMGLIL